MVSGKIKDKKVFILGKDNVNWSIDRDRENIINILKTTGFKVTRNIMSASCIFCVWADLLTLPKYKWVYLFKKIKKIKIIGVITNDVALYPAKIDKLRKIIDIFIAPSRKINVFLKNNGLVSQKIPFFVNPKIFRPLNLSRNEICKILKIQPNIFKDKIIIGSFQRDSLGKDLSKPKWQKNPDLLLRILKRLPKNRYIALLAGPRRHYVVKKCREMKIPYFYYGNEKFIDNNRDDIFVNNLPLETINMLYNISDLYIVASKSEGGPKQVIESSLTKTMVFSTPVGLAPDILSQKSIFQEKDIDYLVKKIILFFKKPGIYRSIVDYNYNSALRKMNTSSLQDKYKELMSKC